MEVLVYFLLLVLVLSLVGVGILVGGLLFKPKDGGDGGSSTSTS